MQDDRPISLDDEGTWPNKVIALLSENFDLLRNYETQRTEFDLMGTSDYILAGQPENPWRSARESILLEVDNWIRDYNLLGYHCTRPVRAEINAIERNGLCPLSTDFLTLRLENLVREEIVSEQTAIRLKAKNCSADPNRQNMIWFLFSQGPLRDESGVMRLFRYWGGEALFYYHEYDKELEPLLRNIGTPCIVVAAVPASAIETFMRVGERVVASYLERRNVGTRAGSEMEGYVRQATPVRRVIQRTNSEFERLTGCTGWRSPM